MKGESGRNSCLAFAGSITMVQAIVQAVFSGLAIAQYFCLIDLLRGFPVLLFVRVIYFQNPDICGARINIGQSLPSIPDQAFVLMSQEPLTVTRTFIINCCCLGISALWFICSAVLMRSESATASPFRWPWVMITMMVTAVDIVAGVIFLNDTFYTQNLNDSMQYIGATATGVGNAEIDTSAAAWGMAIVYSRFVFFILMNIGLVIVVLVAKNKERRVRANIARMANEMENQIAQAIDLPVLPTIKHENEISSRASPAQSTSSRARLTLPVGTHSQPSCSQPSCSRLSGSRPSCSQSDSDSPAHVKLPRVNLNKSFSRMKRCLFPKRQSGLIPVKEPISTPTMTAEVRRPPSPVRTDFDKKRSVNFPENLLSLPQRLENMIAEQQRRLDQAVIDTAGRSSPTRISQSLPQLSQDTQSSDELLESIATKGRRRRSTVAELQRELPWSYVEASANMRDNLPEDEELPPVPLPDYTVHYRRASVHRNSSSVSAMGQRREEILRQPLRSSSNRFGRFILGRKKTQAPANPRGPNQVSTVAVIEPVNERVNERVNEPANETANAPLIPAEREEERPLFAPLIWLSYQFLHLIMSYVGLPPPDYTRQ